MMIYIELLRAARTTLEDPRRWTKGAAARTKRTYACFPDSDDAACWCLLGAVDHAARRKFKLGTRDYGQISAALFYLRRACPAHMPKGLNVDSLAWFNDNRRTTHDVVMTVLNTAIAMAVRDEPMWRARVESAEKRRRARLSADADEGA